MRLREDIVTYDELADFLREYQPIPKSICRYCGAERHDDPQEILAALSDCNNCWIDIAMLGQWTGYGIQALKKAFLQSESNPAWRLIFEKIGLIDVANPPG